MLATVLYRVEGKPDTGEDAVFSDVVPGAWYAGAVAWISDQSIMTGYGGFGVNDPVTREQVVAAMYQYARIVNQEQQSAVPEGYVRHHPFCRGGCGL